MDVAVLGILEAARRGRKMLFRTGAAFVSTRLGIEGIAPLTARELGIRREEDPMGGLVVAGSYVPKTGKQLERLIQRRGEKLHTVVLDVKKLLDSGLPPGEFVKDAVEEAEKYLKMGQDVLVMTSRDLIKGKDERESLMIGSTVAEAVLAFANGLKVRPRYVIAKVS